MTTIKTWTERLKPEYRSILPIKCEHMQAEITELRDRVIYLDAYIEGQKDAMRVTMDELAAVRQALKVAEAELGELPEIQAMLLSENKALIENTLTALTEQVQPAQGDSYESIWSALQRIETVIICLPTFEVVEEGGIEACAENVVQAIVKAAALLQSNAERVPLSDAHIRIIERETALLPRNSGQSDAAIFARAIEAAHGIRGKQ